MSSKKQSTLAHPQIKPVASELHSPRCELGGISFAIYGKQYHRLLIMTADNNRLIATLMTRTDNKCWGIIGMMLGVDTYYHSDNRTESFAEFFKAVSKIIN